MNLLQYRAELVKGVSEKAFLIEINIKWGITFCQFS